MSVIQLLGGTIHPITSEIMQAIISSNNEEKRNNLTPLARNEWICRITIPKQEETRQKHLIRLVEDLQKGKKRPCCRQGCPHHNPNAEKYFK